MTRSLRRVVIAAVVLPSLLAPAGCERRPGDRPEAKASPPPSTPVPAPEALVADVVVRGPDASWGKLQSGVGGPLAPLPPSLGAALVTLEKLDPALAAEIDGAAPAYAVVARQGGGFGWTVAFRVRDVDHARQSLLEGKTPHFSGRGADGGLTVLAPRIDPSSTSISATAASRSPWLLALSPLGYLVASASEADLVTLTPYATRTLPSRPLGAHAVGISIPHDALAGVLREKLLDAVGYLRVAAASLDAMLRTEHGGRAPDLGDPAQVIEGADAFVRAKVDVLADVARAEVGVDVGDDDLQVELSLVPGAGPSAKAFAHLVTADAAPLLTLDARTDVALLSYDDSASRASAARAASAALVGAFKPSLSPSDITAIEKALASWESARGDWLTLGLVASDAGSGPVLALRTPAEDPALAMNAVSGLVGLSRVPTFHTILERRLSVREVSMATAEVSGVGAASTATFRRKPSNGRELAVAWASGARTLRASLAEGSASALAATRDPEGLLGSDIVLAGKLGSLRNRSTSVVVLRPNLEPKAGASRASLVLGLGRDGENGWGRLDVDDRTLRLALERWADL